MGFKKIISGLILACGLYADGVGVKETNFSLSTNTNYWDGSYFSSENYNISGSIHIPIYQHIGGSIYTGTGRSYSDYDIGTEYSYDGKYYYGGTNIFIRDSSIGKVGAWLTHSENKMILNMVNLSAKDDYHTDEYGVYGDYYLDTLTITSSVAHVYIDGEKREGMPIP